jgi:hypothetical protein
MLLLNEKYHGWTYISLSTQSGNFWMHARIKLCHVVFPYEPSYILILTLQECFNEVFRIN